MENLGVLFCGWRLLTRNCFEGKLGVSNRENMSLTAEAKLLPSGSALLETRCLLSDVFKSMSAVLII